jgi:beta-lactamase class A
MGLRVALLAISLMVATVAGAGGSSPASYAYELTRSGFDTQNSNQASSGKSLVDIEVRWDGSQERFTAVWFPVSGTVHTLIQGTSTEWSSFIGIVGPLAGRWMDVEVAYFGTNKRYSAIFYEDGDDYGYALHTTDTDASFQAHLDTYFRSGRSIIDFEAYTLTTGETRYAGAWVNDPNQPQTHLYYNLEFSDVAYLFNPMQGRIIDLERYYSSLHGEDRYAVIVAGLPGGGWSVQRNITSSSLSSLNSGTSDSDTHLIDLDVRVTAGGTLLFNAVWGNTYKSLNEVAAMPAPIDAEPLTPALDSLVTEFETTFGVGTVGIYAKNLRTNQSVSYRGNEMSYLASATKTAIHIKFWRDIEAGRFNATDTMNYTTSTSSGSQWYVDERPFPGFASGAPGFNNDLGQAYTLNRFDQAMMSVSDNGATSALVRDSTYGVARAPQDLTEWLASETGIGRGWGLVTSIQDADRVIVWQGQQTTSHAAEQSYFLLPGYALGPRTRSGWRVCTVGGQLPTNCVSSFCSRCTVDANCLSSQTCDIHRDPWGQLASFFGLSAGESYPLYDSTTAYNRYYSMGLNSATPRAVGNLWEGLMENRFLLPATTSLALANMNEGSWLNAGNAFPNGISLIAKSGSKSKVCTTTGVFRYGGEDIVVAVLTKDLTRPCSDNNATNDVSELYFPQFGLELLNAMGSDLDVVDPALDSAAGPAMIRPGESLAYFAKIENENGGDADPVDVQFYLSLNDTITTNDTLLTEARTDLIPGYGNEFLVENTPLPAVTPGVYYVGWIIDSGNELPELDESNKGVVPVTIQVQASLIEITDLTFTSKTTATWSATPDTAFYYLHEGTSSTLPQLLDGTTDSCRFDTVTTPLTSSLGRTPPSGEFYWYQVQAESDGPFLPASSGPRSLDSVGECGIACAHPKCETGAVLDPVCDTCVAAVCAADSFCCTGSWDALCVEQVRTVCNSLTCPESAGSCTHTVCSEGGVLIAGCDDPPVSPSCASAICAVDSYCCDTAWDNVCVGEVDDYCGATCE